MKKFEEAFKRLNPAQHKAVETIDGPVLVIAGPGTGKTEVLSLRAANILNRTGLDPSNILCLTFTDNAARNMRERLESIIGQSAYHVGIYTFHSFGTHIINRFQDYFTKRQLLQQIDELGSYELLKNIFEQLAHTNPFSVKVGEEFVMLKDTLQVISWLKKNALTPVELATIIKSNADFIDKIAESLANTFAQTPSGKQIEHYQALLRLSNKLIRGKRLLGFPELASEFAHSLGKAIDMVQISDRYAPSMTSWRNAWCSKDANGRHVLKDAARNIRKMNALVNIYQRMLDEMSRLGLYDFDDMIIEAVHALENNSELRLSLQEQYQYILVDEFQDTNKAQLRMLKSLGDNPVNENRPNIMVVGDDDQAIYAFQGAEVSNIVAFSELYDTSTFITLDTNYRSTPTVLQASFAIAQQISDRLTLALPVKSKTLQATKSYKQQALKHNVFISELAQYDWIAQQIDRLIRKGSQPEDIAVIAPRHVYLERLMPYLGNQHIPVAYERRENILDAPIIVQLLNMASLVVAITENNQAEIDRLFGEVLTYAFWEIPDEDIIQVSLTCYDKHKRWLEVLQTTKSSQLNTVTKWFIGLARRSKIEPMEYILDELMGASPDGVDNEYDDITFKSNRESAFTSPMRQYYFNSGRFEQATDSYLAVLGQLSALRQRLRQWKPNLALYISDLIAFAQLHRQAHLKIIDDNPHTQTTNAVQVMTAFKAKGLEFGTVFVINAQDEIWGPTARSPVRRITLPKNLPIAPSSDGDNDKLRLLYVSLTRAKHHLFISSYTNDLANKLSPGLSFLGGNSKDSEPVHPAFKPSYITKPDTIKSMEILATDWAYRFRQILADKPRLFEPILSSYRLSVTHLNNFIDLKGAGPQYFLVHNLLRFPEALTPSAAYGDTIHKTLQWIHLALRTGGKLPSTKATQSYFADTLLRKHLRSTDSKRLDERGRLAIAKYMKERSVKLSPKDLVERGFNNDGVIVGGAKLSGKIDKLHFLRDGGLEVIDFKTGKPSASWQGRDEYEKIKLHKYRQQLLFYKFLVENSASFHNKLFVRSGALEFVEPNEQGDLVTNLDLVYDTKELNRFSGLITAVWQHIMELNFPDISTYSADLKGTLAFEEDLLSGKI